MHVTTMSALVLSTSAATLSATAAFSASGRLPMSSRIQSGAVSRLPRGNSAPMRSGPVTGLRMGFLDNMFKPKVSEDDPVWMQRDFKIVGRKDGVWEPFTDDATGEIYYFNSATQETLWEAEYLYVALCQSHP